ncbi:MAG: DUF1499 domain-containing protein [Desulfocapsaceae bacterium]|nr:DUF1499 domain-containing protein [Desulfocapsaceae bacterium]
MISCTGSTPVAGGVRDGDLLPCPDTPNCVSTAESREKYSISPLTYRGTREQAISELKIIVEEMTDTKLHQEREGYLWWECRSKIFGFVDDLEMYLPVQQPLIYIRSASRVGYSDFGVNRKRVDKIKQRFMKNDE